ncbi:hypothetical protein DVH24_027311 [Malus domestica]|uniref:Uncharacterized protein n=1 Tax=Malus domestica TaxID=3750 RepID=A0A498IR77_MALDO|nr:hypothetical protein DVH24_027311 [Malus domestica]
MRAFRFAGSIRQLFKKLTGARAGDASAVVEEPNVKVDPQTQKHLASLVPQSGENTTRIKYLELVANHFAKHGLLKGSPPLRSLVPSKEEANGGGKRNGKGNGNDNGKGNRNGNDNEKGKGNGNGNGNEKGNGKGGLFFAHAIHI